MARNRGDQFRVRQRKGRAEGRGQSTRVSVVRLYACKTASDAWLIGHPVRSPRTIVVVAAMICLVYIESPRLCLFLNLPLGGESTFAERSWRARSPIPITICHAYVCFHRSREIYRCSRDFRLFDLIVCNIQIYKRLSYNINFICNIDIHFFFFF